MAASIPRVGRAAVLATFVLVVAVSATALAQRDAAPPASRGTQDAEDGWLGIVLQDVTSAMAGALGLDEAEGVLVASVQEGSPAEEAGLREGDVIVRFDRRKVEDSGELADRVRRTSPGKEVRLEIVRDGERETVEVEVGARPERQEFKILRKMDKDARGGLLLEDDDDAAGRAHRRAFEVFRKQASGGWLGVQLQDLGEQLGGYFGVDEGALIQEVVEDSPAQQAGLQAGDVIVGIAGEDVESAADVTERMAETEPGQEIEVQVVRDRSRQTFEVTLGERKGAMEMLEFGEEGALPRAFKMPRLEGREAPRAFWFQNDEAGDGQLREDVQELREELRELRQELRELQREFQARQERR